ncbi:MAG: hypothetical protein ACRDLC_04285 [Actinomycetota bacterium]
MPRITIHVGGREQLEATISKATPMGLLGTEAIVRLGPAIITGTATALRALADALVEAADLAEEYDVNPDAYKEREQAERPADR